MRGDPNGSTTPPFLLFHIIFLHHSITPPRGAHSFNLSKNLGESSLLIAAVVSAGLRPPKNSVNHHPTTDINQPNPGKQPPTTPHLLTY